jgi:hypothetical protein
MKILKTNFEIPDWVLSQIQDLAYDQASGCISWKRKDRVSSRRLGVQVGSKLKSSGRGICFAFDDKRKTIQNKYVAWFLHYGQWPEYAVFHKDGDQYNDRIDNLICINPKSDLICEYCNKNKRDVCGHKRCSECLKNLNKDWREKNKKWYNAKLRRRRLLKRVGSPQKPAVTEKTCKVCLESKEISCFEQNKCSCKPCRVREAKERRNRNPEVHRKWRKRREEQNPSVKIANRLRQRIWQALKGKNKHKSSITLTGCSMAFLVEYLESKFQPGMTWKNYGNPNGDHTNCWHIDHIIPCASFDLSDPEQQVKCFHYTNLQPLWAKDNIRKKDKILVGVK